MATKHLAAETTIQPSATLLDNDGASLFVVLEPDHPASIALPCVLGLALTRRTDAT